jgi:prepilin-type N-terminal cleavage/methylation domain-containing protein
MVNARRNAFTIMELLVVLVIILLLAGLMLAGVDALRRQSQKQKTATVISGIKLALETTGAQRGGTVSSVEHPLAGSSHIPGARSVFIRSSGGAGLNTTGEALVVQDLNWIPAADRSRVILPDDLYVGAADKSSCPAPALYGMPRSSLRVLGAADQTITRFRRLPGPGTVYWDSAAGALRTPLTAQIYPDPLHLYAPVIESTLEAESAAVIAYVMGHTAGKEMRDLGAVVRADSGVAMWSGRIRRDDLDGEARSVWEPATYRDSDGSWYRYRLRGQAFYDAWGVEILVYQGPAGIQVLSAGPDGCFRWSPGVDGVFQTEPGAAQPAGDDEDGSIDNLSSGGA